MDILPTFQRVDTCAAEFEAQTPYLYSAYELADEANPTDRRKILILGGGPNRIGQGIEFDYCCCQASFALSKMGFETIMYNCNPETVSTDYDTADRLYFEPLTLEHVLNVIEREQPQGVIVQFGGQTPLNLAAGLQAAGVNILGTSPQAIWLAEDREAFSELLSSWTFPSRNTELPVRWKKPVTWPPASGIRFSFDPRSCWAGGQWRWWRVKTSWRGSSSRRWRPRPASRF